MKKNKISVVINTIIFIILGISAYIGLSFDYLYPNSHSAKSLKEAQNTLEHISKEISGSFSLGSPRVRSINTWTYPGAKIILSQCINKEEFLKILRENGIVKSKDNVNFCKNDIRLTINAHEVTDDFQYCSYVNIRINWMKDSDC